MNDKDFFNFASAEYKSAFDLSNALYQRAGLLLTAQIVLGGGLVSLGRHDLARRVFERVDIFLFYLFALAALFCLVVATVNLIRAMQPRDYPKVMHLSAWRKWRDDYAQTLNTSNAGDAASNTSHHERECLRGMLDRFVEATDKANDLNQIRLRYFQLSIRFASFAAAFLGLMAVFSFVLKVQGI